MMPLRLFDTMEREKRIFRPIRRNKVGIYTCGPSVYSFSHIGNFRTYLFEDILVRYLRYKGFHVKRVMNITDIEDKAITEARRLGISLKELESPKMKAFLKDFDTLKMERPDVIAKASDHVPQMAQMVRKICANGYCIIKGDGTYFNVRKSRGYGMLRRLGRRQYLGSAPGDDYSKEGFWDFILWKRWTKRDNEAGWDGGSLGDGRPGWHIECSAMSAHYLGETFDIHCGGSDNIFPHHENEIAQSRAASGRIPARFWMHARHLTIGKKKMSKRTGNVVYVRELMKAGIHPECLRYYLISERYRDPLDFTYERFEGKVCRCEEVSRLIRSLKRIRRKGSGETGRKIAAAMILGFERAMDDDLDTRKAFDAIFRIFKTIKRSADRKTLSGNDAEEILKAIRKIDTVLGVFM